MADLHGSPDLWGRARDVRRCLRPLADPRDERDGFRSQQLPPGGCGGRTPRRRGGPRGSRNCAMASRPWTSSRPGCMGTSRDGPSAGDVPRAQCLRFLRIPSVAAHILRSALGPGDAAGLAHGSGTGAPGSDALPKKDRLGSAAGWGRLVGAAGGGGLGVVGAGSPSSRGGPERRSETGAAPSGVAQSCPSRSTGDLVGGLPGRDRLARSNQGCASEVWFRISSVITFRLRRLHS